MKEACGVFRPSTCCVDVYGKVPMLIHGRKMSCSLLVYKISSDYSVLAIFCQSAFSSTCIVSVPLRMLEVFVHYLTSG